MVNFNHEMRDHQRVLPALVRQMTAQLGNYVSSYFRDVGIWPSLHHAVASNRRLFVIIDKRVASMAYSTYFRHRWIHSERLLQSTWRGDVSVDGTLQRVLPLPPHHRYVSYDHHSFPSPSAVMVSLSFPSIGIIIVNTGMLTGDGFFLHERGLWGKVRLTYHSPPALKKEKKKELFIGKLAQANPDFHLLFQGSLECY